MSTVGEYRIEATLDSASHRKVHRATRGAQPFLLLEFGQPSMADQAAAMAERIDSAAVAPVVDRFEANGKAYLVLQHQPVTTAAEHAQNLGDVEAKVAFASAILTALQGVHGSGVVLNSLSLETIWLSPEGDIRFSDLSVALPEGADAPQTAEGVLDPRYVSPERTGKVAHPLTRGSDYYSFGLVLYHLLTGKLPFESDDLSRLFSLHVAKRPEPPATVEPTVPDGLSRVVLKLLEKSPRDRYQSAEGILWDLVHFDDAGFAVGSHDLRAEFTVSDTIYGREKETDLLRDAVGEIGRGQKRLVTISGYSGVGKSTIVTEFQRLRGVDGSRLVTGKFQQYKKDIPYFAIIEAFEQLFDILLLSKQEVLDGFRADFVREIGDQGLILTSIFPKLELIVGAQAPVEQLVGEEAENRFNYLFLKLVQIVATQERPLVLFLDDLQWTDLVSLNVLRALLRSDQKFLLVVLSYRSNEVGKHHPFRQFLDEVLASDLAVSEIRVGDLRREDVSRLVTDSLGREDPALSATVFEKTHGNAFFVHQLLKGLADRGLFKRDPSAGGWFIAPEEVAGIEVSSNVVEFMQTRLRRFPSDVLGLLRVIGAVGHRADLDVLSVVTGRPVDELLTLLDLPLADGLMIRGEGEVVFSHDKVQEACYQLNDSDALPHLHLAIATTLMRHGRTSSLDEIFALAGHLDKAFDLLADIRDECVHVYMLAARKSKEISAYKEFLVYVRKAMDLLQEDIPAAHRFEVYREYHIALYLNSLFDEADAFFEERLLDHPDMLELRENYFSKVSQDSMRGRYREATEFGMEILRRMGIELKIDPSLEHLARDLQEVEALFEKTGIAKISDLQNIGRRDVERMEFISEIILATVPAAFFFNPTVACLLIFTTLKLATQNGVYEAMAYPLSVASTPFILVRNDYQAGYEYAEYAIQIAANHKRSLGNAKHLFVLFCWHWSRPMKDDTALDIARDAHHLLMQGGDIQMAGYTFYNTITYLWERGERLETVAEEAGKGLDFNVATQNIHGIGLVTPHHQVVQTLLSEDDDVDKLGHGEFDEDVFLKENAQNTMGLCFFWIFKTQLAYICGNHDDAYAHSVRAREILHFITGFPSTMSGIFYGALSRCERFSPGDEGWAGVTADLEQLRQWSEGAPENFRHKLLFLEAEIAVKEGDAARAIRLYSEAIEAARESRFTHEIALVNERFSVFWFNSGNRELGAYYLRRAYQQYELWGAARKLGLLEQAHPDLFLGGDSQDLDLINVIRAQNVLAQETRTDALLRQMMRILLEVSGADKAFLILEGDPWTIEAYTNAQGDERILESTSLSADLLSVDMVNYVIRTGQTVQLEQFSGLLEDAYISRFEPKSLLVLPVATGGEIIAVIYLEHSTIRDIFSPGRQQAISLLSAQVAISLNNASIYNRLEELVEERTLELARQNELLQTARQRADMANQAKSEFLANMSHELRTPLNAVAGYSELLSGLVEDPKQQNYLNSIRTAGRNLLTLINDILDLSKIEAGRMEIHPSPISLKMICGEIEQIFALKISEKGLGFLVDLPAGTPDFLFLDETRIRQVLLNLVGNAVKFTEEGYIRLRVQCQRRTDGSFDLTIAVKDSGIGIPKDDHDRIFQSFEQSSRQDHARHGGTGLGLSITRQLVDLMGGRIQFTSTPGAGSEFTVFLPAVEAASARDQLLEPAQAEARDVSFSGETILVVDDVDSNRVLIAELLTRMNLEVYTAGNGQEALLLAAELHPDLVFMDIRMPVMDGLRAASRLKENPSTRDIPVVALTASSSKQDKQRALEKGFDGFLLKPISMQELIAELSTHLTVSAQTASAPGGPTALPRLDWGSVAEPDLLRKGLQTEALPLYEALGRALIIGDVKRLARLLEQKGRQHEAAPLVHYARDLMRHAELVDVRGIKRTLAGLPQVLGQSFASPEG